MTPYEKILAAMEKLRYCRTFGKWHEATSEMRGAVESIDRQLSVVASSDPKIISAKTYSFRLIQAADRMLEFNHLGNLNPPTARDAIQLADRRSDLRLMVYDATQDFLDSLEGIQLAG